jgi:hypothetical protein
MTTVCSGAISATDMLNYTAFSIVFMVVSVAIPFTAASISGGTIGLALSHAFEAAFIAQTVIRPITSALQNGFKMVGQVGRWAKEHDDGDAWVRTINAGRPTQRLNSSTPQTNQRVPAPDSRGTSAISPGATKTTLINPATAQLGNRDTTTVGKTTRRT